MNIEENIYAIISDVVKLPLATLSEKTNQEQLWDSFTHIDLILTLEETFQVKFESDEVSEMLTPQAVCRITKDKIAQQVL
jgi:acyl carrier protein